MLGDVNNRRTLDLGSGSGKDSFRFIKKGAKVVSYDISINRLKSQKFNVERVCGDAEDLSFKNNIFDIVFGRAILHHLKNFEKSIFEVFRVLKPGGSFLVIEPLSHNPIIKIGRKWREKYDGRLKDQRPFDYHELPKMIESVFGNVEYRTYYSFLPFFQAIDVFFKWYLHKDWSSAKHYSRFYFLDSIFTNKFPKFGRIQVCLSEKSTDNRLRSIGD